MHAIEERKERRVESEVGKWRSTEAGKMGEKERISGGRVVAELKAQQAGNKKLSLALLLLSPQGLGKNNESSDEDEEEEKEKEEDVPPLEVRFPVKVEG